MAIAVMGDESFASSLIPRLARLGFDPIHARRGGRAFAKVLEAADVIFCAAVEQAGVGIEVIGRPPAPFILMASALPDAEAMLSAMRHGVVDVVAATASDEELGVRVRTAIERAKPTDLRLAGQLDSLQRDQRAGRYIQRRMLPSSPATIDRYRLAHRVSPSMILSGDMVDYFRIAERHFLFYIADVSGHGASSAFVTVILKNFFRQLRRAHRPRMLAAPGEMLAALNRELLDQGLGKHVTLFVGVVDMDADTMAYANAGHFPYAIHAANGSARFLETQGKPVGLFDDVEYDIATAALALGDSVVTFSDGVLEVMHEEGLQAKESRLTDSAAACAPDIAALWRGIGIEEGSPGPDDMTCLVVAREA